MSSFRGNESPFAALRALIRDPADASKLSVGPAVIQRVLGQSLAPILYGPYWVVAVGRFNSQPRPLYSPRYLISETISRVSAGIPSLAFL